jgi:molybdopterin-guanine dinucleotide biosynthesis protein B
MKHTHHAVDLDRPGKDSFRHRQAGAEEVVVVSDARWALLRETPAETDLRQLAARMAPVDLVLVEGFKQYDFPKIEVFRPAAGGPPMWPDLPGIVAVATDDTALDCPHPLLPLNDPARIATWIATWMAAFVAQQNTALERHAAHGMVRRAGLP